MFNCLSQTKNIYFDHNFFYIYTITNNLNNRSTLGSKLSFEETYQFKFIIKNLTKLVKYYRKDLNIKDIRKFYINYSVIYSIRAALKVYSINNFLEYHRSLVRHYDSISISKSYLYYNYHFINNFIIQYSIKHKLFLILSIFFFIKAIRRYRSN